MAASLRRVCEIDDCYKPAVTWVFWRLLCPEHALPYISQPEQLKVIEPVQPGQQSELLEWRTPGEPGR